MFKILKSKKPVNLSYANEENSSPKTPTTFIVGSPEFAIRVKAEDVTATKLHALFKTFRQPEVAVFQRALESMKKENAATVTLTVAYSEDSLKALQYNQITDGVYQKTPGEFWI